LKPEYLKW